MSLLLVIGMVTALWLLVAIVCVALCLSAAEGDRRMARSPLRLTGTPRRFARRFRVVG